jgi:amino acid adenylation domain-containing protein
MSDRLFAALRRWAAERPSATAVHAADGELTFVALAEQTRMLAGALRDGGAGPGVAVGLRLDRSRLSLPGLLAVWWLGATAVPLSARDPAERASFVLSDSGVRVLLGIGPPDGALPRPVRSVDASSSDAEPVAEPLSAVPLSCAYVIYTSGTTGWPKGVEIAYRSVDTFLAALGELDLAAGGMGVNAVSPAFDGWLWCALLYLMHGQGMAILDPAADLGEQIAATQPRTVCLTPSLLAAVGAAANAAEVLVAAGEPVPPRFAEQFAGRRLLNVYGPTEATIAATWADSARGDDVSTIGRPLPGYTAHVLDETLRPVPVGTAGELYLGGQAVALGYRNRPDLTAERFLPDPWRAGGRMYRTGDVVSLRPDGLLEYRGRADTQVKVRGFRVELAELERAAAGVDGTLSAAAFLMSSDEALGLAVVPAAGTEAGGCEARVRERCVATLPDQMVPAVVIAVDAIPTTTNGKADRSVLARLADARATGGRPPATNLERRVSEVWSGLLNRPVGDMDGNFFELGGHSLLAARAVGELRTLTGLPVSMRHLLANPTVAGLARELEVLAKEKEGVRQRRV